MLFIFLSIFSVSLLHGMSRQTIQQAARETEQKVDITWTTRAITPPETLWQIGVRAIWNLIHVPWDIINLEAKAIALANQARHYSLIERGQNIYLLLGQTSNLRIFDKVLREQQRVLALTNQIKQAHHQILDFERSSVYLSHMKYFNWEADRVIHMATCNTGCNLTFSRTCMPEQSFRNVDLNLRSLDPELLDFYESINLDLVAAQRNRPTAGFLKDTVATLTVNPARALLGHKTYDKEIQHKQVLSYLFALRPHTVQNKTAKYHYPEKRCVTELDIAQAIQPLIESVIKRHPDLASALKVNTYNQIMEQLVAPDLLDDIYSIDNESQRHAVLWWQELDKQLAIHQENVNNQNVRVAIEQRDNLVLAINNTELLINKLEHIYTKVLENNAIKELNELSNTIKNNPNSISLKDLALTVNKVFLWKKELLTIQLQINKAFDQLAYLYQCRNINIHRINRYKEKVNIAGALTYFIGSSLYNISASATQQKNDHNNVISDFQQSSFPLCKRIQENSVIEASAALLTLKAKLDSTHNVNSVNDSRCQAIDATLDSNLKKSLYSESSAVCFTPTELSILQQRGIDLSQLDQIMGTALDHALTREELSLIKEYLKYYTLSPQLSEQLGVLTSLIKKSMISHSNPELRIATLDKAYLALRNLREFALGVGQQVGTEVKEAMVHAPFSAAIAGGTQLAIAQIATMYPNTAIAAQGALVLYNVFNNSEALKNNFIALAKSFKEGDSKRVGMFGTAAGLNVFSLALMGKNAINNNWAAPKYTPSATKAITWKQIFETKLGLSIKPYLEEVKGRDYFKIIKKIENLDLKKNSIISRDRLHNDHMDIADRQGYVYLVLNYDGTVNLAKTQKAVRENRRINL